MLIIWPFERSELCRPAVEFYLPYREKEMYCIGDYINIQLMVRSIRLIIYGIGRQLFSH